MNLSVRPYSKQNYNLKLRNNDNNESVQISEIKAPEVAFKRKKEANVIERWIAKYYGKWCYSSNPVRKFSENFSKLDTSNATKHFQVAGSLLTSGAYAYNTMTSDKFNKDNAVTLAVSQILGFVAPTLLGYTVDHFIASKTKEKEYKYAARRERLIRLSNMSEAEKAKALKGLTAPIKGFRTLVGILTFTMMYRYVVPVAIAPLSNKIGDYIASKFSKKPKNEQQVEIKPEVVSEISTTGVADELASDNKVAKEVA